MKRASFINGVVERLDSGKNQDIKQANSKIFYRELQYKE